MSVFNDKLQALKDHLIASRDEKGLDLYEDILTLLTIHFQQTKEFLTKVRAIVN